MCAFDAIRNTLCWRPVLTIAIDRLDWRVYTTKMSLHEVNFSGIKAQKPSGISCKYKLNLECNHTNIINPKVYL